MREIRSLASLSPDLLARKGRAKPAMRRQPFAGGSHAELIHDDLGWNDWGSEEAASVAPPAEVAEPVPVTAPAPAVTASEPVVDRPEIPEVLRRIEELGRRIAETPVVAAAKRLAGRRAAFTLRLDSDRHLRLRMTSTVLGRSAQDIVTEALDQYLSHHPDIASLADQARKHR